MQIIKIDTRNRTVSYVEYSGAYTQMYALLECAMFELAAYVARGDVLMVDEEGWLNDSANKIGVFFYRDLGRVYCGNGLVLGIDAHGDDVEPSLTLEQVKRNVVFGTLETRGNAVVFSPFDEGESDEHTDVIQVS